MAREMTPTDLTLLFALCLCIGFLCGYRYHVYRVRKIVAERSRRLPWDFSAARWWWNS